jgi:hypothetical protein
MCDGPLQIKIGMKVGRRIPAAGQAGERAIE